MKGKGSKFAGKRHGNQKYGNFPCFNVFKKRVIFCSGEWVSSEPLALYLVLVGLTGLVLFFGVKGGVKIDCSEMSIFPENDY